MPDDGLATSLWTKIQSMQDLSPQPCIYKAPSLLREVNEACYRPYAVSIGPLYYGHESLEAMQDCKLRCLKMFLEHPMNSYSSNLKHYLKIIRELEVRVRNCYAETINLPSDDFNEMILVDSAFVICVSMTHTGVLASPMVDMIHMRKRNVQTWYSKLKRDLFLLENQVPFFVLERLFQEAFGVTCPDISFRDLAFGYIKCGVMPVFKRYHMSAAITEKIKNAPEIAHFVDLLRMFFSPSTERQLALRTTKYTDVQCPSASKLRAVGVKFMASKSTDLMDITFSKGVLQISPIKVSDSSESYYRSMILFEQCHLPIRRTSYILDYVLLLEKLIKTPEDVEILVQHGIIDDLIGSEDAVARLFNDITKQTLLTNEFYYLDVCRDLNTYANTRWNQWKAILKRDYFSHPWAAISVVYALILLILTLLQTVGTFISK